MPSQMLDYSGPRKEMRQEVSASQSIVVGIVCWCLIGVAAWLGHLAAHLDYAGLPFGAAAILILLLETPLAFYGLLCGLVDWRLIRPVSRGVVGAMLNLAALSPVALLVVATIIGR